jgi:hypothetical protein
MLTNHLYNLMLQLVEENKAIWRIKDDYIKDSDNCDDCQKFWKNLEELKEKGVEELQELIKKHDNK